MMLTVRDGGQSKPMPRFRRQTRGRFKPSRHPICSVSWTPTRFPFHTGTAKKLTFGKSPIITVIGKALWDVGHAPKDQNNRRKYMPDYAVWEIHPVMKLTVQ